MTTIFSILISYTDGFHIQLNWYVFIFIILIVMMFFYIKRPIFRKSTFLELTETEIGYGGVKGKFKVNSQDLQVGYMFWVELSTRKIGLEIDERNDIIVDIYKSWYEFFKISRELIKSIPAVKIKNNDSSRELVNFTIYILNTDIRSHLTKWQAKYRRWWDDALSNPSNKSLTPQEIQRLYPFYQELMVDMMAVNKALINYKSKLNNMVFGNALN